LPLAGFKPLNVELAIPTTLTRFLIVTQFVMMMMMIIMMMMIMTMMMIIIIIINFEIVMVS
jgi:hypothetical protein